MITNGAIERAFETQEQERLILCNLLKHFYESCSPATRQDFIASPLEMDVLKRALDEKDWRD